MKDQTNWTQTNKQTNKQLIKWLKSEMNKGWNERLQINKQTNDQSNKRTEWMNEWSWWSRSMTHMNRGINDDDEKNEKAVIDQSADDQWSWFWHYDPETQSDLQNKSPLHHWPTSEDFSLNQKQLWAETRRSDSVKGWNIWMNWSDSYDELRMFQRGSKIKALND